MTSMCMTWARITYISIPRSPKVMSRPGRNRPEPLHRGSERVFISRVMYNSKFQTKLHIVRTEYLGCAEFYFISDSNFANSAIDIFNVSAGYGFTYLIKLTLSTAPSAENKGLFENTPTLKVTYQCNLKGKKRQRFRIIHLIEFIQTNNFHIYSIF